MEECQENYIKNNVNEPNAVNKTIYQERNRDTNTILIQDDKPLIMKDANFGNDIKNSVINDVNYPNEKVINLLIKHINVYNQFNKKEMVI